VRRTILATGLAILLAGCVTPVIPLPPPLIEDLSFEVKQSTDPGASVVEIKGAPNRNLSGAWVFIVNERGGKGVMTNAGGDGAFAAEPLPAQDKDRILLWAAPSFYDATGDVACGILDFASGKALRCQH